MLKNKINSKLSSMSKRKLLFIIGEHQNGKTQGVQDYLVEQHGDSWENYYIDLGLYLQQEINQEQIDTYNMFPQEFEYDSVNIISQLFKSKQEDFLVIDHCEWLLAENQTEWLKILMREAEDIRTIIVIVPEEYSELVPSHAYSVINWGGGSQ
ncbi:hypothetical protein [Virgibacillus salexigens]|jgi:hypothetical protein|uniref:AAA domain-containing protein n=1 Tax=Virgibacillus kapii TaxID=1638645 RepID=A0ABQ2DFE1_9BACI|nr:hypothetical protein [Virgibacillus kapii]GGJ55419.1 hypothetical protein GCM10007111_17120 [Virgibacillus kapii]